MDTLYYFLGCSPRRSLSRHNCGRDHQGHFQLSISQQLIVEQVREPLEFTLVHIVLMNFHCRGKSGEGSASGSGMESLEGYVTGLYQEAFNAIVYLINRSITTTNNANTSITVVDMPGFQNPR